MSHPAWVCGLKQFLQLLHGEIEQVTPCVGVWIETAFSCLMTPCSGHTLRGCVD